LGTPQFVEEKAEGDMLKVIETRMVVHEINLIH